MHKQVTPVRTLLAAAVLALSAQAHAVVDPGHISLNTTPRTDILSNFALSIQYSLDFPQASTGVLFYFASGSLKGVTMTADRGASVYQVQAGDVFSNASIASNPNQTFIYGLNNNGGVSGNITAVGNDFYLGVRSGAYGETPDTFGWAHFTVDSFGKVGLVSSAISYGDGGIIVGTLQAVPEPSSLALMGLGLAGLAWRARRAKAS